MRFITKVRKNTGMNPVARAVAQQKLKEVLLGQKIYLYMMHDGDECREVMEALGSTIGLIGYAANISDLDGPELNVLRGGLSACQQLLTAGVYDTLHTPSIAMALDAAEKLNRKVSAENMNRAIHAYNLTEYL